MIRRLQFSFSPLVLMMALASFGIVHALTSCQSSIDEIQSNQQVIQVYETDNDTTLINASTSPSLSWTFKVTSIGVSNEELRTEIDGYFHILESNTSLSVILRDALNNEYFFAARHVTVSNIRASLTCTDTRGSTPLNINIVNNAVNEYATVFDDYSPYTFSIREDISLGDTIFEMNKNVTDDDKPPDERNEFGIKSQTQGSKEIPVNYFDVIIGTTGDITLISPIDYDSMVKRSEPYFKLKVFVRDEQLRVTENYVTINVLDVDDQKPTFDIPGCTVPCQAPKYEAHTDIKNRGALDVKPKQIRAYDQDSLNYSIKYSIVKDPNSDDDAFEINEKTGRVTQMKDVTKSAVVLKIEAQEIGGNNFTETASLLVLLGNSTQQLPPETGKSVAKDNSSNMEIIVIVVGVVALVIIIACVIALIICHKRVKRATIAPVPVADDSDRPATPVTEEEEMTPDTKSEGMGSKEVLINPLTLPTPTARKGQLPPLQMKDTSTETEVKKKRSRRRKKNKEPEIYDGTREYEKEVDPEFFKSSDKQKIKRSTRSKDTKTDPKYWMTVPNENET